MKRGWQEVDNDTSKQAVMAAMKSGARLSPQKKQASVHLRQAREFQQRRQMDAALASYGKAIALSPDLLAAYLNRGFLLAQRGENELALADFDRAIELKPDAFSAYNYRGALLVRMKHFRPALESLEKALQLNPASADVYNNIGLAFMGNQQVDIALEYYEKAIELDPKLASAYNNYANALNRLNLCDAAIECYDRALALAPGDINILYSKAFPLLVQGRLEEAWPFYAFRFRHDVLNQRQTDFPEKLWLGETSLEGKTILLYHDAGLGDTIQFCRYARPVSALGAKVILEVQPALFNLMKGLEGVDELIARSGPLTLANLDQYPPFDVYCPFLALPLAFRTTLETIPGPAPYLFADPEKVAVWEARLGEKTKPRVGLVWSGNPVHQNDVNRSIMLLQLLPFLPDNCEYVSLQKDIRDADRIVFEAMTEWKHFEEALDDFSDTAALCSLMDVVVSVDTSVAHLAGALGRPTWLMLPFCPEWRWMLDRRDSPWYPDMRLYRQDQPGDWGNVFEAVRSGLLGLGMA